MELSQWVHKQGLLGTLGTGQSKGAPFQLEHITLELAFFSAQLALHRVVLLISITLGHRAFCRQLNLISGLWFKLGFFGIIVDAESQFLRFTLQIKLLDLRAQVLAFFALNVLKALHDQVTWMVF